MPKRSFEKKIMEERKMAETKSKTLTPEEIAAEAAEKERKHNEELETYYNERVKVFIPKPEGEKENSITVTHNGVNFQIMYDREVEVPRYVALIIDESKKNKDYANTRADELTASQKLGDF